MDAKEYMKQVKRLDVLIDSKMSEIESLKAKSQRAMSCEDEMLDVLKALNDRKRELESIIESHMRVREDVLRTLEDIKDPVYIEVLYRRYFKHQHWESIAYEMSYSYQHIHKLHQQGLSELSKLMEMRR